MTTLINGIETQAEEFAFDGCHKLYIIETIEDRKELEGYGYDFFPMATLQEAWDNSCPLRFISSANLQRTFVNQAHEGNLEIKVTK